MIGPFLTHFKRKTFRARPINRARSHARGLIPTVIILSICLASCAANPFARPTSNPVSTQTSTPAAPAVTPSLAPTQAATPAPPDKLVIWLPPQFDPNADTPASILLKDQLDAFSAAHNNIPIEVRIKGATGPGGLLDTLSAANVAAPLALPDLVALSRSDLEVAALKGLLKPFNGSSSASNDVDWFAYARQMTLLQGSSFGLPFAGDALVLLYRPTQIKSLPTSWDALLSQGGILAFPAGDPQALFTLSLYLSAGGEVEDSQHRPVLNPDQLTKVLNLFVKGTNNQNIPAWVTQYQTDGQAWQAFKEQRSAWVVTWASNYLAELPADTTLLPLLPVGSQPLTIATGWVWALGKPQAKSNQLSVELAEWLVKSDFLAQWTAAAGYLPPRPTSLAAWTNQSLQTLLSQVVLSAQLRPADDLMVSLGPALRDATLQVLKGQSDAVQAAQAASEHLKGP